MTTHSVLNELVPPAARVPVAATQTASTTGFIPQSPRVSMFNCFEASPVSSNSSDLDLQEALLNVPSPRVTFTNLPRSLIATKHELPILAPCGYDPLRTVARG